MNEFQDEDFPIGEHVSAPSTHEIADHIGSKLRSMRRIGAIIGLGSHGDFPVNKIRFKAGDNPGELEATYRDAKGKDRHKKAVVFTVSAGLVLSAVAGAYYNKHHKK